MRTTIIVIGCFWLGWLIAIPVIVLVAIYPSFALLIGVASGVYVARRGYRWAQTLDVPEQKKSEMHQYWEEHRRSNQEPVAIKENPWWPRGR